MKIEEVSDDESTTPMLRPSQLKSPINYTGKTLFSQLQEREEKEKNLRQSRGGPDESSFKTAAVKDLVNQSGILSELKERETPYFAQSISICVLLSVIYAVLQTAVFIQFRMPISLSATNPQLLALGERTGKAFLSLLFPVYYSHRLRNRQWMQFTFLLVSVLVGAKNLLLIMAIPHGINYDQFIPSVGLGTLWAYCLLQLHLPLAILNLTIVFGLQYIGGLRLLDLSRYVVDLKRLRP